MMMQLYVQTSHDSLREAAQMLLAAATDPGAYMPIKGMAPFQAFALLIVAMRHPLHVQPGSMAGVLQQVSLSISPNVWCFCCTAS